MQVQKYSQLPNELMHGVLSNLKDDAKSLAAMSATGKHHRTHALYTFSSFPDAHKQQQLLKAVYERDETTIRFILSSRIHPNLINQPTSFQHRMHNAWACAISSSRENIVNMLASYPGAVPTLENLTQGLLHHQSSLFPIMLNKALSADPNLLHSEGTSMLNSAIESRKYEIVPILIQHTGVDINNTQINGHQLQLPPLGRAIQYDDEKMVNILLTSPNIDVNKTDQAGNAPLHLLLRDQPPRRHLAQSLLSDTRLNPNLKNAEGLSPLHMTSRYRPMPFVHNQHQVTVYQPDMKAMEMLLKYPNIDVNLQDNHKGNTALHICAKSGNSKGIELLLRHPDINLNIKNRQGETARDVAKHYKNPAISQMLKQDSSLLAKIKKWKI
ncbi:hypothetical protein ED28_08620 [[Pantoea] beijingensis]|uniref:Uncharacterized protein n=1 Tax=[Pantoea] beijingensis TaxID=1324864 RepID=A0A443IEE8_9GAMM|nr:MULTISPECIES: ankyrin repeat domain-containing protein [Erwiniaceae]RWR02435.1 hypothetical protein ED28_08620 [[Pantoea] beijingensis]